MPSYKYLYVMRKIDGQRSAEAIDLLPPDTPPDGYEVVPTAEAEALVAYLISLNRNYPLPEAPEPPQ
jgi:cytochrome c oxidase cbb3-type subunit 2